MKKTKILRKQQKRLSENNIYEGPVIPANKVSPEVIESLRTTKVPQLIIPSHTTITQAAQIYYRQYMRLFKQNNRLNDELVAVFQKRNSLAERYNILKSDERQNQENVRRKRRYANQIQRDFICPWSYCNKSYGSEGSLTQHVKLKHQEYYKSGQYEMDLQKIIDLLSGKIPDIKTKNEDVEVKQQLVEANQNTDNHLKPQKIQEFKVKMKKNEGTNKK